MENKAGLLWSVRSDGTNGVAIRLGNQPEYTIGKSKDADIRIRRTDVEILDQHCILKVDPNGAAAILNKSVFNPVLVNNKKIIRHKVLYHGDVISVGPKKFRYENNNLTAEVLNEMSQKLTTTRKIFPTPSRFTMVGASTPTPSKKQPTKLSISRRRSASGQFKSDKRKSTRRSFSTPHIVKTPLNPKNSQSVQEDGGDLIDFSTPTNNTSVVEIETPPVITPKSQKKSRKSDKKSLPDASNPFDMETPNGILSKSSRNSRNISNSLICLDTSTEEGTPKEKIKVEDTPFKTPKGVPLMSKTSTIKKKPHKSLSLSTTRYSLDMSQSSPDFRNRHSSTPVFSPRKSSLKKSLQKNESDSSCVMIDTPFGEKLEKSRKSLKFADSDTSLSSMDFNAPVESTPLVSRRSRKRSLVEETLEDHNNTRRSLNVSRKTNKSQESIDLSKIDTTVDEESNVSKKSSRSSKLMKQEAEQSTTNSSQAENRNSIRESSCNSSKVYEISGIKSFANLDTSERINDSRKSMNNSKLQRSARSSSKRDVPQSSNMTNTSNNDIRINLSIGVQESPRKTRNSVLQKSRVSRLSSSLINISADGNTSKNEDKFMDENNDSIRSTRESSRSFINTSTFGGNVSSKRNENSIMGENNDKRKSTRESSSNSNKLFEFSGVESFADLQTSTSDQANESKLHRSSRRFSKTPSLNMTNTDEIINLSIGVQESPRKTHNSTLQKSNISSSTSAMNISKVGGNTSHKWDEDKFMDFFNITENSGRKYNKSNATQDFEVSVSLNDSKLSRKSVRNLSVKNDESTITSSALQLEISAEETNEHSASSVKKDVDDLKVLRKSLRNSLPAEKLKLSTDKTPFNTPSVQSSSKRKSIKPEQQEKRGIKRNRSITDTSNKSHKRRREDISFADSEMSSLDESLSNVSELLSQSTESPNISGIEKLASPQSKSPRIEPSSSGVKTRTATHKVQKTPKNDLTDVKGIKKLMATPKPSKSPKNDLRDVKGVKQLLTTPKPQRTPKNDLTDVKGVKKILATPKYQKSPKNELVDISGINELLSTPKPAHSPMNDLTNVSGLRSRTRTQKEIKSPENDLTKESENDLINVQDVKGIMQTPNISGIEKLASPQSQRKSSRIEPSSGVESRTATHVQLLSQSTESPNISGIEKLASPQSQRKSLRIEPSSSGVETRTATHKVQKTPKNDLSDVKGIKKLMATPKPSKSPKNDLGDVKGVKQLLTTPKPQRTPKNDLTDVKGVKKILATPKQQKSPKNELVDISGINELLSTPKPAPSPMNDLTNVSGLKRSTRTQKKIKSPENDLTNVQGVKRLLRTPKVNKEPENDLTDVRGVKKLMTLPKPQKPHKDDLTDVKGVKKIMATPKTQKPPKDDLTNVAGVKKLMATPKEQKAPRNELVDISGVKELFSTPVNDAVKSRVKSQRGKSPVNDLTNVQGVKRLMKTPKVNKEPENDLTNVQGVKRLMQTPKSFKDGGNEDSEISFTGVAAMFESTFDALVDKKPAIRTYASKSPRNIIKRDSGVETWVKEQNNLLINNEEVASTSGIAKSSDSIPSIEIDEGAGKITRNKSSKDVEDKPTVVTEKVTRSRRNLKSVEDTDNDKEEKAVAKKGRGRNLAQKKSVEDTPPITEKLTRSRRNKTKIDDTDNDDEEKPVAKKGRGRNLALKNSIEDTPPIKEKVTGSRRNMKTVDDTGEEEAAENNGVEKEKTVVQRGRGRRQVKNIEDVPANTENVTGTRRNKKTVDTIKEETTENSNEEEKTVPKKGRGRNLASKKIIEDMPPLVDSPARSTRAAKSAQKKVDSINTPNKEDTEESNKTKRTRGRPKNAKTKSDTEVSTKDTSNEITPEPPKEEDKQKKRRRNANEDVDTENDVKPTQNIKTRAKTTTEEKVIEESNSDLLKKEETTKRRGRKVRKGDEENLPSKLASPIAKVNDTKSKRGILKELNKEEPEEEVPKGRRRAPKKGVTFNEPEVSESKSAKTNKEDGESSTKKKATKRKILNDEEMMDITEQSNESAAKKTRVAKGSSKELPIRKSSRR